MQPAWSIVQTIPDCWSPCFDAPRTVQEPSKGRDIVAPDENELIILICLHEACAFVRDLVDEEVRRGEVVPVILQKSEPIEAVEGHMARFEEMLKLDVPLGLPMAYQGISRISRP